MIKHLKAAIMNYALDKHKHSFLNTILFLIPYHFTLPSIANNIVTALCG